MKSNRSWFGFDGVKSQSELLGLAIVVLLIAVGLLFVIGFVVLDTPTNSRSAYINKQLATNLNDALLETTTTCRNLNVRELYLVCMDNNRDICPLVNSSLNPNSVSACDYLNGFIENRLGDTLDKWGTYYQYSYRYDAINAPAVWSHKSDGNTAGCDQQRSPLILKGDTKQVIIYLDIYDCKKK